MAEAESQDLELTPQEVRILRNFFRRHALPYVAGFGAVAVACLALALLRGSPSPAPPEAAAESARQGAEMAEIAEARAEIERLLAELAEARGRAEAGAAEAGQELSRRSAAAADAVAALEKRLEPLAGRVAHLESRGDDPAQTDGVETRAGAAADSGALGQRLLQLEQRMDRADVSLEGLGQDLLERMDDLEETRGSEDRARNETQQSIMSRLYNLEGRIFALEKVQAAADSSSPPAAPDL
jgi:chromosome segregation ATPase